jgi:hypothetical protein
MRLWAAVGAAEIGIGIAGRGQSERRGLALRIACKAAIVFHALMQLVKATRVSMLIATHNMELAGRMDRRVSLEGGRSSNSNRRARLIRAAVAPYRQFFIGIGEIGIDDALREVSRNSSMILGYPVSIRYGTSPLSAVPTSSSRPIGGSARWRQSTRSHARQPGPIGSAASPSSKSIPFE